MLSHYDAVVWYTGDDYVTREPGQPGGTGHGAARGREQIDVRDFLNEGGKLFYTGQNAGQQYAEGYEFRNFGFPEPDEQCTDGRCRSSTGRPEAADGCIAHDDDFLQYYLGAYTLRRRRQLDGRRTATCSRSTGDGEPVRRAAARRSTARTRREPGAHGDVRW